MICPTSEQTVVIVGGAMQVYTVSSFGEHATVCFREWDRQSGDSKYHGAEIIINSSFGAFAYTFGNIAMPFRRFFSKVGRDYLLIKFFGANFKVFSSIATINRAKHEVLKARRKHDSSDFISGKLTAERAREAFDALDGIDSHSSIDRVLDSLGDIDCFEHTEYWMLCEEVENPVAAPFWTHCIEPLRQKFHEELAAKVEGQAHV